MKEFADKFYCRPSEVMEELCEQVGVGGAEKIFEMGGKSLLARKLLASKSLECRSVSNVGALGCLRSLGVKSAVDSLLKQLDMWESVQKKRLFKQVLHLVAGFLPFFAQ